MKNKKIFLWAFLFILLAQIGLGISQVCKYLDILQNGKIVKVSYVSIGNIDNYEYKHNQISLYSSTFLFPFKNDIKLVKDKISKENLRRNPSTTTSLGETEAFYLKLENNKDGILEPVSYSKSIPYNAIYCKSTLLSCRIAEYKNKKRIKLEPPILSFTFRNIKLSYSEKQLKKIAGYVNKIPQEKRNAVGVFRYRDGIFLPVDIIVNGKSLNEIAGKKNFEK